MKGTYLLVLTCFLLEVSMVKSQTTNRKMAWLGMVGTFQLNKKLYLQMDAAVRSTDQFEQLQTVFLRTGLGLRFLNGLSFSTGYNYLMSRVTIGQISSLKREDQIWQQQMLRKAVGSFVFQERILLEERFLPITQLYNEKIEVVGRNFALRSRYMLRAMWNFKLQETGTLKNYLFAQQETFINLAGLQYVNNHRFDQFRIVAGIGQHLKKGDIEAGILYRNQLNRNGSHFNDFIFQISQFIRL